MRIKSLHVQNFRCLEDVELQCEPLTILVGRNGTGKSAFLSALELFYQPAAEYSEDDFYNRNTSEPISITVTYTDLTDAEMERYRSHLRGTDLVVEKRLKWPRDRTSQKYYGYTWQHPAFAQIRRASPYEEQVRLYRELRDSGSYPDLPQLRGRPSRKDIEDALSAWEEQHSQELELIRDDGQFFGFREVGQARLEEYTRFLLVPAVLDAPDAATDRKGSLMGELMRLVVETTFMQRAELGELQQALRDRYQEIIEQAREEDLARLVEQLSQLLQLFAPGASLVVDWQVGDFTLPVPSARVFLGEDQFQSDVSRVGHGLQRAFILALLNLLTTPELVPTRQGDEPETQETVASLDAKPLPSLIFAIEEPELYQHPARQRYIAERLRDLADHGLPGVASSVQVIYSTHSPLLLDVRRFHCIRLFRKRHAAGRGLPPTTVVTHASLDAAARMWCEPYGLNAEHVTRDSAYAHLATLVGPWMNEGFFADLVVLVEGPSDRAALEAVAAQMGINFDELGIAVIPCSGKPNLIKAAAIFKTLDIRTYLIWDADADTKNHNDAERHNRALLTFVEDPNADDPFREIVEATYACFNHDLERTLMHELGEQLYYALRTECCQEFGCTRDTDYKQPPVVSRLIFQAYEEGARVATLEHVLEKITALCRGDSVCRDEQ